MRGVIKRMAIPQDNMDNLYKINNYNNNSENENSW